MISASIVWWNFFANKIRIDAEKRQLARYEKAVALMEYGLETAVSMAAEEWGNLSGRMMADVATGTYKQETSGLLPRTK